MKTPLLNRTGWRALLLGGTVVGAATAALAVSSVERPGGAANNPPLNVQVDPAPVAREGRLANSFAPVVRKVAPSVVKVLSTVRPETSPASAGSEEEFWHRFFGFGGNGNGNGGDDDDNNNGGGPAPRRAPFGPFRGAPPLQHGLGSGVIVSSDGYVLTNNHVVARAADVEVDLPDGRQFKGRVVGTDPQTDVALLKIDADKLPALPLADSDKVEVGDVVLAVGNPFGIGQTVTSGIVSATNRVTDGGQADQDFIQTDAAINPGNSGGALVDAEGRLVGVNTAILSRSGGNQGIGFAVPSNLCRWVMNSLVKTGRVERGFLGVNIQDLNADLAKQFRLERAQGALVADVTPGGPADQAGLQSGDVIVRYNHQPVQNAERLKLAVAETTPGTPVPVDLVRGGADQTKTVTVRERVNEEPRGRARLGRNGGANGESPDPRHEALAGVGVADLTADVREELNVPPQVQGAVVTQVQPDSPAAEAGLRRGDVITEVNRHAVKDARSAVDATSQPAGTQTLVKVWSRGGTRYVVVDEAAKAG